MDIQQKRYDTEIAYLDYLLLNKMITEDEWDNENDELIKSLNPTKRANEDYKKYRDEVFERTWENVEKEGGIEELHKKQKEQEVKEREDLLTDEEYKKLMEDEVKKDMEWQRERNDFDEETKLVDKDFLVKEEIKAIA